jgi:sulfatase modifying factor 1
MHGNVYEWCNDLFAELEKRDVTDPTGLAEATLRVFRGGGCESPGWSCRSEDRFKFLPSASGLDLGLRVAFSP